MTRALTSAVATVEVIGMAGVGSYCRGETGKIVVIDLMHVLVSATFQRNSVKPDTPDILKSGSIDLML